MRALRLPLNRELCATTRLGCWASDASMPAVRDWLCLVGMGIVAAGASTFLDFGLRIPGHAILRAVFPMAIGLALVPRSGSGMVMGGSALLTAIGLRWAFPGEGLSLGALTSLSATGPLLDWTLRHTRRGWRLYLGFAAAGLMSNTLAVLVRGGAKVLGLDHATGRPLADWLPSAIVTYAACGVAAGLVSGAVWFCGRRRGETS